MKKLISIFREENIDIISGNIRKSVFLLAVPMFLEMVMATVFNLVDMIWVGRLGTTAIAAVSMGGVVLMIAMSVVFGISISGASIISRRVGKGCLTEANIVIFHTLLLSFFVGIGYIFFSGYSREMIIWMGAQGEVIYLGSEYLKISLFGCSIVVFLSSINGLFRGAGHGLEAMLVLAISNIINILLDPLLIFGFWIFPQMGVKGAALGTVISHAIGVGIQLFLLVNGKLKISLRLSSFKLQFGLLKKMLTIAIPSTFQLLLRMASTFVLMRLVAEYGTNSVAAYGIGMAILRFLVLPGLGIGNAASIMVGQNLGAGFPKRASKGAWLAALYSTIILGTLTILIIFMAHPIALIFNSNPKVIELGTRCIRILTICFIFGGVGIVMSRSLMGAGDAISPMIINFISQWLLQIPLAYYLSHKVGLKAEGVWIAISVSNCVGSAMGAYWFKAGHWQKKLI